MFNSSSHDIAENPPKISTAYDVNSQTENGEIKFAFKNFDVKNDS